MNAASILKFDFSGWKPQASPVSRYKREQEVLDRVEAYLMNEGWIIERTTNDIKASKNGVRYTHWIHFHYKESTVRINKTYQESKTLREAKPHKIPKPKKTKPFPRPNRQQKREAQYELVLSAMARLGSRRLVAKEMGLTTERIRQIILKLKHT